LITIIDYSAGNILSIRNMLWKIGAESRISSDPAEIASSEKLVLPGVGHYDHGMQHLNESGLSEAIRLRVLNDKTPILGICLGAQLMGQSSEEGDAAGLGLIDIRVVKFDHTRLDGHLKVPHMGWDQVQVNKPESVLFRIMHPEPRFYFVHSFHFLLDNADDALTTSTHGYPFTSAFEKGNIYGVQFHPEKSHKYGMRLLENFVRL
jgi:glutamine amidotransferase